MPTIQEAESFSMEQGNHHYYHVPRHHHQYRASKSAASTCSATQTPQTYTRRAAAAFLQWFTLVAGNATDEQRSSSFYIFPECHTVCGTDTVLCSSTTINDDDDDYYYDVAAAEAQKNEWVEELADEDFSDDDSGNPGLNLYGKGQESPPYYSS